MKKTNFTSKALIVFTICFTVFIGNTQAQADSGNQTTLSHIKNKIFNHSSSKFSSKKIIKTAIRHLKKGKGDSLINITKIGIALADKNLKKKFQKNGIEIVRSTYPLSVKNVTAKTARLMEKIADVSEDEPVKVYLLFMTIKKALITRIDAAKTLKSVSDQLSKLTIEDVNTLQVELRNLTISLDKARQNAVEHLYLKAKELLYQKNANKITYRNSYNRFEESLLLIKGYKDADSLQKIVQEKATVRIKLLPPTSGNTNSFSRSAVRNAKKSMDIYIERYNQSTPFLRIGWNISNADVVVKLVTKGEVTRKTSDPKTYHEKKTIKDDKGNPKKITATLIKYKKESWGFINGTAFIRAKDGMLIKEISLYGQFIYVDIWSKLSGNKKAVRKKRRWLIGKKESPFPDKKIILNTASEDFEDSALKALFNYLKSIIQ